MRVVQLITRLIVGGAQRIAIETAAGLRSEGIEVEIWCGPQEGPEGTLAPEAASRGLPLRIVPDLVKEVDPARDVAALRWLTRELCRRPIDLLHTHSSKAGILGRRAGRAAAVPHVVHTIHGWGFSRRTPWPARLAFVAAERAAARWTGRLIAVSDAVRIEGLRLGIGSPELYRVILPGIDAAAYQDLAEIRRRGAGIRAELSIPPEAFVAGSIGRLSPQKNPSMILDAAAALPEIHWIWIGDGPLRSQLETRMRREGLEGRVHLPGLRTDVAACLGAFDLFVLPSLWEGAPLTILEARAAGLPVAAAAVGGVEEIVPPAPAGRCFPAGNARAFIEAVRSFRTNAVAARGAAAQARSGILERSIERMNLEIRAVYADLIRPPA